MATVSHHDEKRKTNLDLARRKAKAAETARPTSSWAKVPASVIDANISDRAVRLFGRLKLYAGKDGDAWPRHATLAKDLRCSVSRVQLALIELVQLGVIEHESGQTKGKANHYRFVSEGRLPTTEGSVAHDRPGRLPTTDISSCSEVDELKEGGYIPSAPQPLVGAKAAAAAEEEDEARRARDHVRVDQCPNCGVKFEYGYGKFGRYEIPCTCQTGKPKEPIHAP